QLIEPGRRLIEAQRLQDHDAPRREDLVRLERLRIEGIDRVSIGPVEAYADLDEPASGGGSERGEAGVEAVRVAAAPGPHDEPLDRPPVEHRELREPDDRHAL